MRERMDANGSTALGLNISLCKRITDPLELVEIRFGKKTVTLHDECLELCCIRGHTAFEKTAEKHLHVCMR